MSGYDVSSFGAALKRLYEGPIADAVPDEVYLLSTLEDATADVTFGGEKIFFPVDVLANPSYGLGLGDGGVLPDSGRRTTVQASVDVLGHFSTTSVTDEVIERSKSSEAAFISAVKKVSQDVVKDQRKRVSQALYGKVLWNVTANSAASVITLASVQYLRVGDVITVGNATTGVPIGTRTITARNIAAKTITVDSNITVALATDGVWYANNGPVDTKWEGLRTITGTSRSLHNVSGSTFPTWDGNDVPAAGVEIGEQTVINLDSRIFEREIGEATDGLTSPAIRDGIAKDLQSQKRFTDAQSVQLKGGFNALMVNDKPIVRDADCTKGFLFLWSRKPEVLAMVRLGQPGFMAPPGETGGGIFEFARDQATGKRKAEYETTYRQYLNLISRAPGATGRVSGAKDNDPVN